MARFLTDLLENTRFLIDLFETVLKSRSRSASFGGGVRLG